jgi:hypothetical protein
MKAAHAWAVELFRAITGKDQRDKDQHDQLLRVVAELRQEIRNEDIALLEKRRRGYELDAERFRDEGNRQQWAVHQHYEQATAMLIKSFRAATLE